MGLNEDPVGAALAARVAALRGRGTGVATGELARELEAIRRMALEHGYRPVVPVIRAMDHVLAKQTEGAPIDGWLSILSDAVRCGRHDPAAEASFAALCSVRLGV